jgi:hypothetical protein
VAGKKLCVKLCFFSVSRYVSTPGQCYARQTSECTFFRAGKVCFHVKKIVPVGLNLTSHAKYIVLCGVYTLLYILSEVSHVFGVSSPISHMLWILIYYVTLFHFLYPCSNFGDWIKFFPIRRLWQKTRIEVICCYVFMYGV